MENILYIVFGWLLGLLSPPIASIIEKHYRKNELRKALYSDLKNLIVRLASSCQAIEVHRGTRNKESLVWILSIYEKYRADTPQTIITNINKLLQATDEDFENLNSFMKGEDGIGLNVKPFSMPFLESVLGDLFLFNVEFQRRILEVRSQISILNQDIDLTMSYHRMTFNLSSSDKNKDIILQNINSGHIEIANRCKSIANKIIVILES